MNYIVDASVILQSILQENCQTHEWLAETLLRQEVEKTNQFLFSSTFLPLGVANGLRFSLKETSQLSKAIRRFNRLPIELIEVNQGLVKESLFKAKQLNTTVYDTSYHLLALKRDAVFVTADKQYFAKARGLGSIELLQ